MEERSSVTEPLVTQCSLTMMAAPIRLDECFNEYVGNKRNLLLNYQKDNELSDDETSINDSWQSIVGVFLAMTAFFVFCCFLPLLLKP